MKTNYAQHLASFQLIVRPNIIMPHQSNARCWHASIKKDVIYNQFESYDKQDSIELDSNPRKRKRMNSDQETNKVLSPSLQTTLDEDNPTTTSTSTTSNYLPVRSMSELTIYYDAESDWVGEDDLILFEEENKTNTDSQQPSSPIPNTMNRREEIKSILYSSFKMKEFIPNQYESINAALDGQDILIVLPAGPSRNVCFQLPVLYQHIKLTTIVIVPSIIYLLQHDDDYMQYHQIPIAFISKNKKNYKKNWISITELETSVIQSYKIVYMTYSDFAKGKYIIQQLYQQNLLSRIIIDEAHCISQWGEDFHFGYLRGVENLKLNYPSIPITAITAISNERIQIDIMHNLLIQNSCKVFNKSILL